MMEVSNECGFKACHFGGDLSSPCFQGFPCSFILYFPLIKYLPSGINKKYKKYKKMQEQLNSFVSCCQQIATNSQAIIWAIRKSLLNVTKEQMGISTQLANAYKLAKNYDTLGLALVGQSMKQLLQFFSGELQKPQRQLIDLAKLNFIRTMELPEAISTAMKLLLFSRHNVVSGEYSQGERMDHQLVVEGTALKKQMTLKLGQILQPASDHMLELFEILKKAAFFVEVISSKSCLKAQKARREEFAQIKKADQQQEQTIKVQKVKCEQKRQAREAREKALKQGQGPKHIMTTLEVFEDEDNFIYQNIRNLFMEPQKPTPQPQIKGSLGEQSSSTLIRNDITNLIVHKDKLLMALEDGEVDEVREAISDSRAGVASLEHQLNQTIRGLEAIISRAQQQFLQANDEYSNNSEQARNEEVDKYPNVVADSEESAKLSLASLKEYIPKKLKNIDRQEAIVELSNKREVASGKMRMLMKIKEKVCDIKTTYEFIGKDLEFFMAFNFQDFMTSKTSINKIYDYAEELQTIHKMSRKEQCATIEINSKSKPIKVFDAINDVARGFQDEVRCRLSAWKYEMINNIKALMENHTATEKWRAESVGKLNLVSTIHKDGSRIKKAFILAKKCLVYNDCITEWKSSRIDAKDQVDIKLYYGEEVIQRFYNADLL